MQITKFSFSKQYISWNEPFDLSYTIKMGSNQTISINYDGCVYPEFVPNNAAYIDQNNNWNGAMLLSGVVDGDEYDYSGSGAIYTSISKGATKTFSATGGYFDPEATVSQGFDKGLTYEELMLKHSGNNGASRAYPIGLWIVAVDGYGSNGRLYYAYVESAATFLLSREAPVINGHLITDDVPSLSGIDTFAHFGAVLQGKSKPRITVDYLLDPLDPTLNASFLLKIRDPDGKMYQTHSQADGVVTVYGNYNDAEEGELLYTYESDDGVFKLEPLDAIGHYTCTILITDREGLTATYTNGFEVIPYFSPSIDRFQVERYIAQTKDDGEEVYPSADDGVLVRFNIVANAASITESEHFNPLNPNQCSLEIVYGQDDEQTDITQIFVDESTNGVSILLSYDDNRSRELIPLEFSSAFSWNFTLTLSDFFEKISSTVYIDRAGADFNVESFGVAVGMRSRGNDDSKLFEVADTHESKFYGGIAGVTNYNISDESKTTGDNYIVYGEEDTYGKWIDGTNIVRRVIEFGSIAINATLNIPIGIVWTDDYVGLPISLTIMAKDSVADAWFPVPYAAANVNSQLIARINAWSTDPTLTITCRSSSNASGGGYAIIEYTKLHIEE